MKRVRPSVSRLDHITKIGVEDMGELADGLEDSSVLRLENLDTDLSPPLEALEATRKAIGEDRANSYLPFLGLNGLRQAVADLVGTTANRSYDWRTDCLISAGGLSGVLNVLLATLEAGDRVLLTDSTYVGLINRVRLAGGVPVFVPWVASDDGFRLDLEALEELDPRSIKLLLLMSPSMPSGAVLNEFEWQALADFTLAGDALVLYDSAMERILFDGRTPLHPASLPGLGDRVVTVGSASKEYRMIGWRVGWVVGPAPILADTARVSISNVVCQTGIAMQGVEAAIRSRSDGIAQAVSRWQARRDLVIEELRDFDVIRPHGGWSLLVDVSALKIDGAEASRRLLERAAVAATPMVNWGTQNAARYLRVVFSNEPRARLVGLGDRWVKALG